MKILVAIFVILVPSLATKEYADDISQLLDNPDLILELVKRLGADKTSQTKKHSFSDPDKQSKTEHRPYVPVVHGDGRSCKTLQYKMTIIRTDDSKKAGATFLGSSENVPTSEDCLSKCCSKSGCDLAVYENKTKHNCYLFKCQDEVTGENKCKFDYHADYISTTLTTTSDVGQTGSDNPHKDQEDHASLERVTGKPKAAPSHLRPTPRPTQLPHSVALGSRCQLDLSCEDPHAVCYEDTCQCQAHFQEKDGVCKETCGPERVACERRGTGSLGPDCIPRSQLCDGVTQCAGGGDEIGCTGYPSGSPPSKIPTQDGWDEKASEVKDGDSTSSEDSLHSVAKGTDVSDGKDVAQAPADKSNTDQQEEHSKTDAENTNTDTADGDTDKEASNTNQKATNSDTQSLEEISSKQDKVVAPVQTVTNTSTTAASVKVEVVDKEEEVYVSKEKVIVTSPTDGAQGPIVALSLGLAITLMLLVFVGCRLRNVRHRLRKGRPLHSNEADYLINGMYL